MATLRTDLLERLRTGGTMNFYDRVKLVMFLSVPAILAQLSTVLMQYIDASMVGNLGAQQSASIGLVSTTTWLFGGFCMATNSGFSVQVAQLIGAGNFLKARQVLRQALTSVLIFSVTLALIGVAIAAPLPGWLGGDADVCPDASAYFFVYAAFLPMMQLCFSAGAMLQASGNMKVPAVLNVMMCVLDVVFNYVFIYLCGMGVKGAALGTGLAEAVTAAAMLWFLLFKSPELALTQEKDSFMPRRQTLKTALGISSPMWLQNVIMRGAHLASTIIVAPLGMVAIAANSFAITAESLCYMPGYGLEEAATTLVGQSIGARRKNLARSFALMATGMGAVIMTLLAVLMYFFAPEMMGLLSKDADVVALGARCLRLEAFAETFYAVSIVAYGACVGAGDTLVPSVMNFACMWVIRIGLALVLVPSMGLMGYWVAMVADLNFRGIIFLVRILGRRWMNKEIN